MEHRYARRVALELKVLLRTSDGVLREGRLKNASATGAGVVVTSGAPPRSNVVDLILPPSRGALRARPLRARGFVVRVQNNELGLLWLDEYAWRNLSEMAGLWPLAAVVGRGK